MPGQRCRRSGRHGDGRQLLGTGRIHGHDTGDSRLAQDLGVDPGSSITGFPPGTVGGVTHSADAVALQAQKDLTTACGDAAGRTPFTNLATELGGTTLTPGVYRIGAAQVAGT